jgi:predicted phosphate transport protein (TIGR00153 family)
MFRSSNVIMWLSRRQERKILDLCKTHLDKTVDTVQGMKRVVYAFCDNDFETLETNFKMTFDSERAADDVKHAILRDVSTGPLHPIDRQEVIRLVLTADDIAENAKSGARKLRLASTDHLPNEIKEHLRMLADRCVEIVELVRVALGKLGENLKEAIDMADQIEILEEDIDEFRLGLLKLVLQYADEVASFGTWFMLLNAIENMEEVADRSEDVGDVIRSIAILG